MGNIELPTPEEQFGRRVRAERQSRLWSQQELAGRLKEFGVDLHFTAIAKIEQRDSDHPRAIRLNEAIALSKAFQLPVERLLYSEDELVSASERAAKHATETLLEDTSRLLDRLDELRLAKHEAGHSDGKSLSQMIVATLGIMKVASEIDFVLRGSAPYSSIQDSLARVVQWLDDDDEEDPIANEAAPEAGLESPVAGSTT